MQLGFKQTLETEGQWSIGVIAANMYRNKQVATGQTIQSLRVEATDTSLAVYGASHIKTLESGVLPGTYVKASDINIWGNAKGYWTGNSYLANTIARRIFNSGSVLFRKGGRTDVWTDVIPSFIERIKERIGEQIVNIKLVENGD